MEARHEVERAVGREGAVGELAGGERGVRLDDECHLRPAGVARGHRFGRFRRAVGAGRVRRRRARGGPVGRAAHLGGVVIEALAAANHATGEAEHHGGRGGSRRRCHRRAEARRPRRVVRRKCETIASREPALARLDLDAELTSGILL